MNWKIRLIIHPIEAMAQQTGVRSKLPLWPLLTVAYTTKHSKRMKTTEENNAYRKEFDQARMKTSEHWCGFSVLEIPERLKLALLMVDRWLFWRGKKKKPCNLWPGYSRRWMKAVFISERAERRNLKLVSVQVGCHFIEVDVWHLTHLTAPVKILLLPLQFFKFNILASCSKSRLDINGWSFRKVILKHGLTFCSGLKNNFC